MLFRLLWIEDTVDESQQAERVLMATSEGRAHSSARRCTGSSGCRVTMLQVQLNQLRSAVDGQGNATTSSPRMHLHRAISNAREQRCGRRGCAVATAASVCAFVSDRVHCFPFPLFPFMFLDVLRWEHVVLTFRPFVPPSPDGHRRNRRSSAEQQRHHARERGKGEWGRGQAAPNTPIPGCKGEGSAESEGSEEECFPQEFGQHRP